ncbi:MAG: hypothetical protein LBQ61_09980 [Spirochaetales bacterium]|nr:hypothetical protein [Spirochaetales bacterium]
MGLSCCPLEINDSPGYHGTMGYLSPEGIMKGLFIRGALRRGWLIFPLLFIFPLALSSQNYQKIIPIDSPIFQALQGVYLSQGLALPSSSGPWSADEITVMLDRLNPEGLSPAERGAYDFALSSLSGSADPAAPAAGADSAEGGRPLRESRLRLGFSGEVNLEALGHLNTEDFLTQALYVRDWGKVKPFLNLNFEAWVGNGIYGFSELNLGPGVYSQGIRDPFAPEFNEAHTWGTESYYGYRFGKVGSQLFGARGFTTNLTGTFVPFNLDTSIPYRGFIAFGGPGWSVEFGRERLSWGAGESGNLMLGSQVDYHTGLRSAFYGSRWKYSYLLSAFPHPQEYYNASYGGTNTFYDYLPVTRYFHWESEYQGIQLFVAHRIEGRLFRGRLGFAVSEAVMYLHEEGYIAPEILIPLGILHNYSRIASTNSLLSLEIDWAFLPGFNLNAQALVDEFVIPGLEAGPQRDSADLPGGYGFLLGVKTALPLGRGMLTASAEGVLTDPYLYLRSSHKDRSSMQAGDYPNNFVVANRYRPNFVYYNEEFLGYRYGNDAIVFNLNAFYQEFGRYRGGVNFFYMVHGTQDKWTFYSKVYSTDSPHAPRDFSTPTDTHDGENSADADAQSRNAPYTMTALSLIGEATLGLPPTSRGRRRGPMTAWAQIDFIRVVNPGNRRENPPIADLQWTLGVGYEF